MSITQITNLPDISFIDSKTLDNVLAEMVASFQDKYLELTGSQITLAQADPNRLILQSCALQVYQGLQFIDRSGKQNLIKYSYDNFLDNLAALKGVTRNPASEAIVTVRFTLSEVRPSAVAIPKGTRVTADSIYFETLEYTEILAGQLTLDIEMQCTTAGTIGNGLVAGQITTLADPIGYVASVINTTTSTGGADIEADESLAERIYLAPSSYSTAGPDDAYVYWAKTYSQEINDVRVSSDAPCEVNVCFVLKDGEIPNPTMIAGLNEYLSDKKIRPLTDLVTVTAPTIVNYNLTVTYYINQSQVGNAANIQAAVTASIADFIKWQDSNIGRDINPSELISRMMAAGAKRVVCNYPNYATVTETQIAKIGTQTISYGGLEDD